MYDINTNFIKKGINFYLLFMFFGLFFIIVISIGVLMGYQKEEGYVKTKSNRVEVNAGGYIKVTDLDRFSGISEVSFNDTYTIVDTPTRSR